MPMTLTWTFHYFGKTFTIQVKVSEDRHSAK